MSECIIYGLSVHVISVSFFFATLQHCWLLLVQDVCELLLQAKEMKSLQSPSTESCSAELSLILCVVLS